MITNLKKVILLTTITFFAITGCKKGGNPSANNPVTPPANTGPDIYICGDLVNPDGTSVAAYWKNGVAAKVDNGAGFSEADGIVVKGADVYLYGNSFYPGTTRKVATYWKNGVANYVTNGESSFYGSALALAGPDVYMAGNTAGTNSYQVATYWKNGSPTLLPGKLASIANSIAIDGSDVYVSGLTEAPYYPPIATYWKNGIETKLTDSTTWAEAETIVINNGDIYVGGYTQKVYSDGMGNSIATLWKNGVVSAITNSTQSAKISSILFSGADIYLGGYEISNGHYKPTYWKNGNPTLLDASSFSGFGAIIGDNTNVSLAVDGSDIYVTAGLGGYWKNDVLMKLSENSNARGIAVIPK